jgi:hypothetical protein
MKESILPQAQTKKVQNTLEKYEHNHKNQGGVMDVIFSFGSTQTISHSKRSSFCTECQR